MVLGIVKKFVGDYNEKELKKIWPLAVEVNDWEEDISSLSDEKLTAKTPEFRERLAGGEELDELL